MFFEIIKSIILGIVQGITEWLPVSSTGHMLLVDEFLQLDFSQDFIDMFFVVIQFGSILAVIVLYFDKLNPFSQKKTPAQQRGTWKLWAKVLIASVPAAIVGLLFDDLIHDLLYGPITIALALIVYGILFIILESTEHHPTTKKLSQLSYRKALSIGCFQMLSLIPGTSRSGSTILGAVFLGCDRPVAAEFSFFMAIPVMLGASGLKMLKYGLNYTLSQVVVMIVGMAVAFVVSLVVIRFLMDYIRKHDFKVFGWYRIVLGVLVLIYFGLVA